MKEPKNLKKNLKSQTIIFLKKHEKKYEKKSKNEKEQEKTEP